MPDTFYAPVAPPHGAPRRTSVVVRLLPLIAATLLAPIPAAGLAQCPPSPPLANHDGATFTECPCFIPNEQAGATFTAPAQDYPLEVLQVNLYWKSRFGGNPSVIEQAIHIYAGALPNPGSPVFTLPGPVLNDGRWNSFPLGTPVAIASGPFTATLEFQNTSSGNTFASGPAEDGACRSGRNVVFTANQWFDACALGVPGDWVMEVVYRPCSSATPARGASWGDVKVLYRN